MNAQLPITYKKPKIASLATSEDFSHLKEDEVLTLAKSSGIISVSLHKVLKRNLDRRNDVAHPSGNVVNQANAEDSISDLVQNVVLKLI
jgi:hypothetical protein